MPYVKNKLGQVKYQNPNQKKKPEDTLIQESPTPVTTQQGTGMTRPDVLNPMTNTYESAFTPAEQIANKEMLVENQKAQVEQVKAQNRKITPEEQALSAQQEQERQQLNQMITDTPQPTVAERNVQAGLATINSIAQTFGGEAVPLDVAQARVEGMSKPTELAAETFLTGLGKVTTFKVLGFSISDIFSKSNAGNVKELTNDATTFSKAGAKIASSALSKGANVQNAISEVRMLEEATRQRYADAQIALSASPQDIAEGADLTEEIYLSLIKLQEQRQSLERYAVTGDKNQVLSVVGYEDLINE